MVAYYSQVTRIAEVQHTTTASTKEIKKRITRDGYGKLPYNGIKKSGIQFKDKSTPPPPWVLRNNQGVTQTIEK